MSAAASQGNANADMIGASAPKPRRKHKRVVRPGTERFSAEDLLSDFASTDHSGPGDPVNSVDKSADDDQRILNELPPHWGKFDAEGRR